MVSCFVYHIVSLAFFAWLDKYLLLKVNFTFIKKIVKIRSPKFMNLLITSPPHLAQDDFPHKDQ